jgi:hypothetical protein
MKSAGRKSAGSMGSLPRLTADGKHRNSEDLSLEGSGLGTR